MIAVVRPHLDGAASSNINVIETTPRYHIVSVACVRNRATAGFGMDLKLHGIRTSYCN
jgi:hypothetical protein